MPGRKSGLEKLLLQLVLIVTLGRQDLICIEFTKFFQQKLRLVAAAVVVRVVVVVLLVVKVVVICPSARQHPSYGDCLEVKGEYYQNSCVLDCVTQCSQSAAHLYEQFLQVKQIGFVTLGPSRCA